MRSKKSGRLPREGSLKCRMTIDDPHDVSDAISIFNVNRNTIVIMDSDKRAPQSRLNATKRRIIDELEKRKGLSWVTKGREIENYIPAQAVDALLESSSSPHVEQYESFFDYLNKLKSGKGDYFKKYKPMLAENTCPHLTKKALENVLDLGERLEGICSTIKEWNK